jgi:integrase
MYNPKAELSIELPAKKKPALYIPTDQEINILLSHIKGKELEIAVYLAAFGPMRRGEICDVESTDVTGNNITVNKSMVLREDKTWDIKQPKTYAGYRTIEYPNFVISRIDGITGRLVKATPDQISHRFERAVKSAKLPNHFRFHDLRHYAASIMHAIGVPDQYIMGRGGWASDYVLKSVYRNELDDQKRKFTNTINGYFNSMQHEMQHKNTEPL